MTNEKSISSESVVGIAAAVLVVTPLIAFSLFSFYKISQSLTDIIKNELEAQSILVTHDANSFISERIIDARVISQADVLETENLTAKLQYLREIIVENMWINDIDIVDEAGIVIGSSGTQNIQGQLFWEVYPIEQSLFTLASQARQGQVYVSEAMLLDGGPSVVFITPITDDQNIQLLGLLAIEVNLKYITDIVSLFDRGIVGEKYVYIVDNAGRVILSDDPDVEFHGSFPDLQLKPELLEAFSLQGNMGNITYTDHDDDLVIAGYADMEEFGENAALDWSLIAIAPMLEITAPVTQLKQILFIVGGVIALLSVFFAYRGVIYINNKLANLAAQADAISQGDFSAPKLPESNRKGAFNTLVIAINRMQVNIHQLIIKLKDREQRLNITLNSIGDGVIATDEKGHITLMNPVAEKLTGWTLEEAEGLSVKEAFRIVDETSRKSIENPIDKVIATGDTVYLSNHTTLLSKDGSEYQIEDSAAPIRSEDNAIHGMILIFSNVTSRKRAERLYRQTLKMDALGKLTGGIAHDYNNMLGVIIGYCDLLNLKLKGQTEALKDVEVIFKSAERGAGLTKKLLDFSRQKPSEIVTLDISKLLEGQKQMLQKTLTVRIDLSLELEKELWLVELDENDLIDTILNICINSMHSIKEVGRLTIRVSNETINQIDANSLGVTAGDYVLLCITDTGCGMDENTKNKIYDPFFTTKGNKGTGLGLSQAYGFVKRSKGAIKVYSELGHGTRQALYFPRYSKEENVELNEKNIVNDTVSAHETILVVDDEEALLQFCCTILKRYGFKVFFAENAQAALHILENEKVDLLLSDVIMPGMNGYQLAAIVREKYPNVKVQLASGFADEREGTVDASLKNNLLLKPYNTKTLLQAINKIFKK